MHGEVGLLEMVKMKKEQMREDGETGLKEKLSFWTYVWHSSAFFALVLISLVSPLNLCDRSGLEKGKSCKKVF